MKEICTLDEIGKWSISNFHKSNDAVLNATEKDHALTQFRKVLKTKIVE